LYLVKYQDNPSRQRGGEGVENENVGEGENCKQRREVHLIGIKERQAGSLREKSRHGGHGSFIDQERDLQVGHESLTQNVTMTTVATRNTKKDCYSLFSTTLYTYLQRGLFGRRWP